MILARVGGLLALGVLAFGAAGCSSRGPEIKGTVTLDGKPMPKARVSFEPLDNKTTAFSASAVCDESGNFDVVPQGDGRTLNPAKYGVTVSRKTDAQGNVPPDEEYGMLDAAGTLQESIPTKYTATKTDGTYELTVEIGEGKVEPIELKLNSQ